jgi:hypothetical protein
MSTDAETVKTRDTIPLWLAVAITVCVSLPFGIWLGRWNLPIWVSFIVWAEYFALGAKWQVLLKIVPAYLSGVAVAAVIMTFYVWLTKELGTTHWVKPNDLALIIAAFVGFCVFIFLMKYIPIWGKNTLPFFNGISMGLGVYFTAAFIHPFPAVVSVYALPWEAAAGAALAGLLGAALGWFNVTILFPRRVRGPAPGQPIPAIPEQRPAMPSESLPPQPTPATGDGAHPVAGDGGTPATGEGTKRSEVSR